MKRLVKIDIHRGVSSALTRWEALGIYDDRTCIQITYIDNEAGRWTVDRWPVSGRTEVAGFQDAVEMISQRFPDVPITFDQY